MIYRFHSYVISYTLRTCKKQTPVIIYIQTRSRSTKWSRYTTDPPSWCLGKDFHMNYNIVLYRIYWTRPCKHGRVWIRNDRGNLCPSKSRLRAMEGILSIFIVVSICLYVYIEYSHPFPGVVEWKAVAYHSPWHYFPRCLVGETLL